MSLVVSLWRLLETANRCFVSRARSQALAARIQFLVTASEDRPDADREPLGALLRDAHALLSGLAKSRFRWESVFSPRDLGRFHDLETRLTEIQQRLGVYGEDRAAEEEEEIVRADLLSSRQLVVAALSSMSPGDKEAVANNLTALSSFFTGNGPIAKLVGEIRVSLMEGRQPPRRSSTESVGCVAGGPESDRSVLSELAISLDMRHASWRSSRPLAEWYGVFADEAGRVTGLSLWASGLSGCLSEKLGALSHITALWLPGNKIRGTIPKAIGQLRLLNALDLSDNLLSGGWHRIDAVRLHYFRCDSGGADDPCSAHLP